MKFMKRGQSPRWTYVITLFLVIGCIHLSKQKVSCEEKSHTSSNSEQKVQAKIAPEPVKSIKQQSNNVASNIGDINEAASSENHSSQQVAEKKQGDSAAQAASAAAADQESEYVQIKPEEMGAGSSASLLSKSDKSDSESSSSASNLAQQNQEKSSAVDDELSAHLAGNSQQDSISQQESVYRPYAELAPAGAAYRANGMQKSYPLSSPTAAEGRSLLAKASNHMRPPIPGYTTMKGKLTGINPIVSQYPHPAPGYPHQMARHLPRGAAAGYAAFRDFVRAHASKYKQAQPHQSAGASYASSVRPYSPVAPILAGGVQQQQQQTGGVSGTRGHSNKLSTTQAYIPHLNSAQQAPEGGYYSQKEYTSSMLNQLYGSHHSLPLGAGRPEYSKDFGMVIHYPQATVYTEPMTVDKLHKLTGAGISQVLAQLQYQITNGQRDESNTIRTNGRHHLGHGLSIHAKEYYAPGKGGRYVPTTAAVISSTTGNSESAYGSSGSSSAASYPSYPLLIDTSAGAEYSSASPALGAGYERVKQAVAKSQSQDRYNNKNQLSTNNYQAGNGASSYASAGQPLAAITNLIGAELESLYRSNALNKHNEQSEMHAYTRQGPSKSHLRYRDVSRPSNGYPNQRQREPRNPAYLQAQRSRNARPRGMRPSKPQSIPGQRYPPAHLRGALQMSAPVRQYGAQQQGRGAAYGGNQQHQQQQQAAYLAAEQAMNEKMSQLLHDFKVGDEQYNGRPSPQRLINQGYPQKVMMQKYQQKYQQQQQQQQQYSNQAAYNQHEGLEIPAGQNDQIGEIADLIEALKSSLEGHRPDPHQVEYAPKQAARLTEDVRYLAGALGQIPSYAMQVPVTTQQQQQQPETPQAAQVYQQQSSQAHQANSYQQQPQVTSYQTAALPAVIPIAANPSTVHEQKPSSDQIYLSSSGYQQQDQAQQSQADYSNLVQQQQPALLSHQVIAESYPANEGVAAAAVSSSSQQQQQQQYQPAIQQYTSSEHSQIINHLVPVSAAHGQSSTSGHLSPIALAAPTESQYQQAQPLSSFVDSLPNDYQELLRQPPSEHLISQTLTSQQQPTAQQYAANQITYQNASTLASSYAQQLGEQANADSAASTANQQQTQYSSTGVKK